MQRPGVVLLPNLLTTGCLFSGFYSVMLSMQGAFISAALAILVAMVLDTLDGRVARMTNTTSDFGAQYDSMADLVSFGVAPAILAHSFALDGLGRLGIAAAFVYTAGAALRLARFNTRIAHVDRRYFQGLPSPAAAALIATLVWLGTEEPQLWLGLVSAGAEVTGAGMVETSAVLAGAVACMVVLAGLAMVSTFSYYSFKDLTLRDRQPFAVLMVAVLGLLVVFQHPPLVILLGFLVYLASGPLLTLRALRRIVRSR